MYMTKLTRDKEKSKAILRERAVESCDQSVLMVYLLARELGRVSKATFDPRMAPNNFLALATFL